MNSTRECQSGDGSEKRDREREHWRQGVYRRLQTKQTTTLQRDADEEQRSSCLGCILLPGNERRRRRRVHCATGVHGRFIAHGGGSASRTWL